jgi:hypothetical protein
MTTKYRNSMRMLLGFYLGIGDFLSAVPVFQRLGELGHKLTIVASPVNLQMVELLSIADNEIDWVPFHPFEYRHPIEALKLFRRLSRCSPELAVVSPHAAAHVSSWKLPLMLKALRLSAWRASSVVGGDGQRLSNLFDKVLSEYQVDGLVNREWRMHQALGTIPASESPNSKMFQSSIVEAKPQYDLVIHPGASRDNKRWPAARYRELLDELDRQMRIAFVGLRLELDPIRAAVGRRSSIDWISGSLTAAIRTMAGGRLILTLDSGFGHVAALLNRPHLSIFGSTDPNLYAPRSSMTRVIYRQQLDCQPCNRHDCPLIDMPCMKIITAAEVAREIARCLEAAHTS